MREEILKRLKQLEIDNSVKILYACESGSRAWGFESKDSDWDVRFIYVRLMDWYLSVDLEHKRDVIELPITDDLDINGWDIRKALKLFKRSNPPLLEWLQSPIVYINNTNLVKDLTELLPDYYSPKACMYHYIHMARGNFREYLQSSTVWLKKYLYMLRPLLSVQWIEKGLGVVPIEFQKLIEARVPTGPLRDAIDDLIARKRAGEELGRGPHIPMLSNFIESEMKRHETIEFKGPDALCTNAGYDVLNRVFRKYVKWDYILWKGV